MEIGNQRMESDQTDGTSLVLNAGYLEQQEKTDRRMQRALTEDSSDTGLYTHYCRFTVYRFERISIILVCYDESHKLQYHCRLNSDRSLIDFVPDTSPLQNRLTQFVNKLLF